MKLIEVKEDFEKILIDIHDLSEKVRKSEFEFPKRKSEIFSLLVSAHMELSLVNVQLFRIILQTSSSPKLELIQGDKE